MEPKTENKNLAPVSAVPSSNTVNNTINTAKPEDEYLKYIIPIGRSGLAIAAGYIGLFSILILPAPISVLFGVLALLDLKKHPEKIGKVRAWFAIISGSLVILAIILLMIFNRH